MAEGEISISGALSFAWSLLSHNWRAVWGVLALNALSWTVLFAGMFANRPDLMTAGSLAMLITKYPLYGAIFRLGAGQGADNPDLKLGAQGLQWRGMELRMFAADILQSVFLVVLVLLVSVAMAAVLMGVLMSHGGPPLHITTPADLQRALGPQGMQIMALEQLALLLVVLFVGTRLLLALPASALSGRVAVLRTWRLTRGSFLRLFLAWVVVQAPVWLTFTLAGAGLNGELTSFTAAQILGYSVLSGALAGAASIPLSAGVQVYFYKALAQPGPAPGANGGTER